MLNLHAPATLKAIAALPPEAILWDSGKGAVPDFGARRQKGEARTYFIKYRTVDGRQRWYTIGRHGAPWTPDMARAEGRRVLAEVAKGHDPAASKQAARKAETVSALCEAYLEAATAGRILTRRKVAKKASTLATDKVRISTHIKTLLGHLKVAAVTSTDIERFRDAVTEGATAAHSSARATGGRGAATRTLGLLGAIFSFGVKRGMRPDNPVRGVERHADGQRQRRLTEAEYLKLGEGLRAMPAGAWPIAMAGAKFLALTGWRRGEMLPLKWSDVDLVTRTARLADTKTGASLRPLSHAACDVLRQIPRLGELVFPASVGEAKQMRGFPKAWARIAAKADLPDDVTPHTLRHSFASIAADLGFSELTIAALLGHKKATVTSRYAHHADAVLLQAADTVADRISELLGEAKPAADVVPLRAK